MTNNHCKASNLALVQIYIKVIIVSHESKSELEECLVNKGNNKLTEHRAIFQRERQQTDKIRQQPENWENRNGPDLVQAFPKKMVG